MFPSDNNSNHENPLEPLLHKKPSLFQLSDHNQNPTIPKQDDGHHDPPFFTDFPSPFFDGHELPFNQILPRRDPPTPPGKPVDPTQTNPALSKKMGAAKRGLKLPKPKERPGTGQPPRRQNPGVVSRKRAGKKDRHSKICTAQGVRDRRMRLSLLVARKFFDLQDMLGYDKASSTIEWLFSKSKRAIRELVTKARENNNFSFSAGDEKTESFLTECEAASEIHEASSKNEMNHEKPGGELVM